jgi:YedE family putative selenium metabolism protein
MSHIKNFFATRWGIISVGVFIGVLASLLQKWGNPGNMGICVACFNRDIAGAVGLHRAEVVQYMRPEIIGFVIGALIAAFIFKEFKARAGSAPVVRFFLGAFAMIGALVFLGCPWRGLLRFAAGDGNAILGLAGLIVGIWIGTIFLKKGYNLGRSQNTYASVGLLMPILMAGFLVIMLIFPQIEGQDKNGILFYSLKGPGAMHAPLYVSLAVGLKRGWFQNDLFVNHKY